MKSVQFKLAESKYKKAKKRLQESGISWQLVCEQMTDHIIYSASLDQFGLPLHEMSPSVIKKAKSEIEGHIETAAWKYIQIQLEPNGRNVNHWRQGMRAALLQLLKSNANKNFKRGYFFEKPALEEVLNEMFPYSVMLASGHLGLETSDINIEKPSLAEMFKLAGVPFSLKL